MIKDRGPSPDDYQRILKIAQALVPRPGDTVERILYSGMAIGLLFKKYSELAELKEVIVSQGMERDENQEQIEALVKRIEDLERRLVEQYELPKAGHRELLEEIKEARRGRLNHDGRTWRELDEKIEKALDVIDLTLTEERTITPEKPVSDFELLVELGKEPMGAYPDREQREAEKGLGPLGNRAQLEHEVAFRLKQRQEQRRRDIVRGQDPVPSSVEGDVYEASNIIGDRTDSLASTEGHLIVFNAITRGRELEQQEREQAPVFGLDAHKDLPAPVQAVSRLLHEALIHHGAIEPGAFLVNHARYILDHWAALRPQPPEEDKA